MENHESLFPGFNPAAATAPTTTNRCCGSSDFRVSWQLFKNGTKHLREECRVCGRFIRYVQQTAAQKAAQKATQI